MSAPNDKQNAESSEVRFTEHIVPGQQDRPCRACIDADSWIKLYGSKKRKAKPGSVNNNSLTPETLPSDHRACPLDKDELGRVTWSFLHTTAAYFPDSPTAQQQKDMKDMMHIFSRFYPCDFCAKDFRKSIKKSEPDTSSQHAFSQWLCQMHNQVNRKTGKPEFDCNKVNERWRDGWKDGSCD